MQITLHASLLDFTRYHGEWSTQLLSDRLYPKGIQTSNRSIPTDSSITSNSLNLFRLVPAGGMIEIPNTERTEKHLSQEGLMETVGFEKAHFRMP